MKTVVVSLYGGLGNQLFQFATGLALAQRHNAQLTFDLGWFETVKADVRLTTRSYALSDYDLPCQTASPTVATSLRYRLSRKFFIPIKDSAGIPIYFERHYHYDVRINKLALPVHLDGYWQSYKYFESIKPLLIKHLKLKGAVDSQNLAMLEKIQSVHSVCVHIRRGDYVSNLNAAAQHGTCGLNYYHHAMNKIRQRNPSVAFFIFSDEIEWAKKHLNTSTANTFVEINGDDAVHLDLMLMTACRDFIIANSSLSWWAAWLGEQKNSHVIAPARWFTGAKTSTKDLIPENWERLDN